MTVLVAGSREVDAGKTTFAMGLVSRLDALGVKPRAGNDYWYDHDLVSKRLGNGRLVGKDAGRLAAASVRDVRAEEINPVHRLWRPIPDGSGPILGREGSEFLVDRIEDTFVINGRTDLPEEVREGLPLDDAIQVESLAAFNELMADRHQPALERFGREISSVSPLVVESYADIARPLRDLQVDAVAVVGAGRVRVFPGERFRRACEVASGSPGLGQLEERVADVTSLLEPAATETLPPLRSETRTDPIAVASAYESAYRELLEVAGDGRNTHRRGEEHA
ncbi:MAG: ATPase [Halodesulfurarchaeum sp.]